MACKEEILVQGILQNKVQTQQSLYNLYAKRLLSTSYRYVGRMDVAEDIVQEAFIKIFHSIHQFKYHGEGSLYAWMDRITINTALQWLRLNQRMEVLSLDDELTDLDVSSEPSYEETETIPLEVLMQFITELPLGYRTVFNLYCIENYSHQKIAQTLGIQEKSSSSQLLRAKRILATKIKEYIKNNE